MGVPGLWSLLEPARHPVELEQLAGKVIAIDMNIWLHQAVKSRAANAGPRTYLAILFRRLCKLIYFGIRPVFVFDGNVPALKQTTMAERRRHRGQLGDKAKRAQERLLHRLLRRVAEGSVTKSTTTPDKKKSKAGENDAGLELIRRLRQRPDVQQAVEDVELFRAPLDPSSSDLDSSGLLHTTAGLEYDDLARDYLDGFNLHTVGTGLPDSELDLNSEAFCALPLQAQLRVVQLAREQLDAHTHRSRLGQSDMADKGLLTENFSQHQIGRLLLRRRLAERHDQLSAELAREEAARQVARLNSPHLTATLTSRMEQSSSCHEQNLASSREWCTTALRIQSQDSGHAILIKKSPLKPLHGHNVKGRTHLTLESLIQLIHQAENEKIDDARITSNSPTKEATSPTPDTDSSRSSANVTTDSASDTTPMKSNRTNFASTVKIVEDHRQFPQRVDRETAAIEATQARDILPPALSPPLVSSELDCSCTNKPEIPVEQEPPVLCPDRGSFLTDNHVEKTENSNSSLTDESTNLKSSASTFNVEHKTPTIIVEENSTNARTLVTEILTTSEEVCDIELKMSPKSDLVSDTNESDADDDDDDFVDVPVPETVSIPVVEDVKDKIVDATSPPSSQDSSSETTDVEDDLKNQIETIPSVGENWAEDEESFTFDDDVLRDEADRLSRQAQTTTTKCIMEAQDLIKMFGMPFVISPEEAEAQCVTLQRTDLVDLVASDDSDVWPFGAQQVCRHLFGTVDESRSKGGTRLKSKHHTPSCYRLEDVQATLGLDVANILRLAMLCGSDYTPGIRNVGPVTAVEILSEFARQVPDPDAQDEQWTQWLCGMDAPDHLVGAVLEPLKQFVDWWHNCGSKTAGESKLVTSPVRRKWLNLRPPVGFPDPKVVQAYLRPNVKTNLDAFKWETPSVPLLVKFCWCCLLCWYLDGISKVTHAHSVLGWSRDSTEAMLSAVLKRQQNRALSAIPLVGPQLITHYFAKSTAPCSQSDQKKGKCDVPDEVTLPSKRARKATTRLRPKTPPHGATSSVGNLTDDTHPSQSCAVDPALFELPSRRGRRTGVRGSMAPKKSRCPTNKATSSLARNKVKESTRRRVVARVALSEDEEDDE